MFKLFPRLRAFTTLATVAGVLALVAACGSGGSSSDDPDQPVTIAVGPFSVFALPWVAQEQGYFEDEGLNVEFTSVSGGATVMIPLVSSNRIDIGAAGGSDVMPAIMKGAKFKMISGVGTMLTDQIEQSANVVVTDDPLIESPKDLEGKTVALHTLGGSQESLIRLAVTEDGGDASDVTFVRLPLANIPTAIDGGEVDAGQALEPIATQARHLGLRSVFSIGNVVAGAPELAYFSESGWADAHPEQLAAFVRAMEKAAQDANADPNLIKSALEKYGEIAPDVANDIEAIGTFAETGDLPADQYSRLADLLYDANLIQEPLPADQWVINTTQ